MSLTNTFLLATVAGYLQFEATKCFEKCKKLYCRILGILNEEDIYELLLQLSDEASEAHQLPLLIDRLTPAEIFSLISAIGPDFKYYLKRSKGDTLEKRVRIFLNFSVIKNLALKGANFQLVFRCLNLLDKDLGLPIGSYADLTSLNYHKYVLSLNDWPDFEMYGSRKPQKRRNRKRCSSVSKVTCMRF